MLVKDIPVKFVFKSQIHFIMRKLLLLLSFCISSLFIIAQETVKYDYCEIVGTSKLLSNKVTVQIDFGEATKFFADNRYKDESGKPVTFNGMIDAMNYMGAQGWEFVQAYAVTNNNNPAVYHYVLKRKSLPA